MATFYPDKERGKLVLEAIAGCTTREQREQRAAHIVAALRGEGWVRCKVAVLNTLQRNQPCRLCFDLGCVPYCPECGLVEGA